MKSDDKPMNTVRVEYNKIPIKSMHFHDIFRSIIEMWNQRINFSKY